MLARGLAYHCYMPPAELDALRAAQMARGEKPRYDGRWRPENARGQDAAAGRGAGRCASAIPIDGSVRGTTRSRGAIEIANAELDDLVIARADGTPTYNFCVVVDDLDMRITHVIRGDDHVNNTPRQINMIRALGATPPVFAHLPTVLTPEGDKLSKRHGARGRDAVRRRRLPARGGGQLSRAARLVARRRGGLRARRSSSSGSTSRASAPSPARFDPEKLKWLNHEHMKRLSPERARRAARAVPRARRARSSPQGPRRPRCRAAARSRRRRSSRWRTRRAISTPRRTPSRRELAAQVDAAQSRRRSRDLPAQFATIDWTREAIGAAIKAAAARHGLKPRAGDDAAALAGVAARAQTPAIDAVLALLGRDDDASRGWPRACAARRERARRIGARDCGATRRFR